MQGNFYVNSMSINKTQGKMSRKAIFVFCSRLAVVFKNASSNTPRLNTKQNKTGRAG